MPIKREPNPRPSDLDYVPAESLQYRVATGDHWYSLAERPEAKRSGMTANDLCYFNFKTRSPAEINWYLYNKVGCRMSTRDGNNYMFSAADDPGIIYLPKAGPPPPVNEIPPKQSNDRTNAWVGIGGKAGTQFVVVGIETMTGYVASLDDPGKGMAIGASINRIGPGFGLPVDCALSTSLESVALVDLRGIKKVIGILMFRSVGTGAKWQKQAVSLKNLNH